MIAPVQEETSEAGGKCANDPAPSTTLKHLFYLHSQILKTMLEEFQEQEREKILTAAKQPSPNHMGTPMDRVPKPLSAYNIFFKMERCRLMGKPTPEIDDDGLLRRAERNGNGNRKKRKQRTGIPFKRLAQTVSAKWKKLDLDQKQFYTSMAQAEKEVFERRKRQAVQEMQGHI